MYKANNKYVNKENEFDFMKIYIALLLFLGSLQLHAGNEPVDSTITKPAKKFTVVLDAGHGGKDPGKLVSSVREKDIALKVVKYLGKELEDHTDIEIVYTRTTDKFLELYQRADIANKAKADLFISVHCNAAASRSAKGNETWVLGLHRNADNLEVVKRENAVILLEEDYEEKYAGFDPNDPASFASNLIVQEEYLDNSIEMASKVQSNFEADLKRKNRGVKQAGFAVLRLSYMPSVLIETGFITNAEERKFLSSSTGQKKVAHAIYDAVIKYKANRSLNDFVIEDITDLSETVESNNTIYKVQIAASKNKIEAKSYNFKKLPAISREQEGAIYRYFTGSFNDFKKAQDLQKKAVKLGYKSAFIVKYENGERSRL